MTHNNTISIRIHTLHQQCTEFLTNRKINLTDTFNFVKNNDTCTISVKRTQAPFICTGYQFTQQMPKYCNNSNKDIAIKSELIFFFSYACHLP